MQTDGGGFKRSISKSSSGEDYNYNYKSKGLRVHQAAARNPLCSRCGGLTHADSSLIAPLLPELVRRRIMQEVLFQARTRGCKWHTNAAPLAAR